MEFVSPAIADAMRRGTFNYFTADLLGLFADKLPRPAGIGDHLRGLKAFLDARSVALNVVYVPSAMQVSDYYWPYRQEFSRPLPLKTLRGPRFQRHARELSLECRKLGIPFLDTTPAIVEAEAQGRHFYWEYDEHMKGEGYLELGRWIYQWRREFPAVG